MNTLSKRENYTAHTAFAMVSLAIVLVLIYTDEGSYSFEGIFSVKNLPAITVYFAIFFAIPTAAFHLLTRKINLVLRIVFGVAVSFSLLAGFYFLVVG